MKQCILCGKKLRFKKFKTLDGMICPICYKKASRNYTQTVRKMNIGELTESILKEESKSFLLEQTDFQISRRINQFVLFDDSNGLVCFPNNSEFTTRSFSPEIYNFSDIEGARVIQQKEKKDNKVVGSIMIQVEFSEKRMWDRKIILIKDKIDCKSQPYIQMERIAQKIVEELDECKRKVSHY